MSLRMAMIQRDILELREHCGLLIFIEKTTGELLETVTSSVCQHQCLKNRRDDI
jgi:hypothetical protein